MGELINGRTPEEIKQALEWMANGCPTPDMDCEECRHNKICKEITSVYTPGDALELIERLESERDAALAKVPKWISVEERLPEKLNENNQAYLTEEVIGFDDEECAYVGQFMVYKHDGHQTFFDGHHFRDDITHWMPPPEPPEEENK